MMLSPHFAASEFECRCGCGYGTEPEDVSPRLLAALEELREILGAPIHINSGCRCPVHNALVKGKRNSQHLRGTAADVRVDGVPSEHIAFSAEIVTDFRAGGIGTAKTFVHLDTRGHKARWAY